MNTDELEYVLMRAERRVLEIQTKLHRWGREDPHRRFSDLFNLVADPAFLLVAWVRVRGNKGARTAGVDGETAYYVETVRGVENFLDGLRTSIKDRSFCPLPVRERMIPKAGGKKRRLGIATVTDRVVQAALKLVLEPIFEADFLPCSYGFRPNHRAHDAVAEVRHFTSHSYEWIVEGDIKACFDEISHAALMDRVRARVGDKRVLVLVKTFLKSGILGEDRAFRETSAGTPQGSILSPLLSNVALSVLDEHFAQGPGGPASTFNDRRKRRRRGLPNYRLIRYADDWCLVVSGTRADAEALKEEAAEVLSTMGLRLSPEKTLVTHIDEGLDFLGWRIQRHRKRVLRLHLPVPQGPGGRDGQGQDAVPQDRHRPAVRRPAHLSQPDAAGLVRLLPAGSVQCHFPVPELLCLGPGDPLVAAQAPPDELEGSPSLLLRRRLVAGQRGTGTVQPWESAHDALPLPGLSHPLAMADRGMRATLVESMGLVERPLR